MLGEHAVTHAGREDDAGMVAGGDCAKCHEFPHRKPKDYKHTCARAYGRASVTCDMNESSGIF